MTPDHDHEVTGRAVASERALERQTEAATVLFGIGPARDGPLARERRLEHLLKGLSPVVRALRWARQVHGRTLLSVTPSAADPVLCVGEADGLLTTEPGIGLLVWTADCVPVALAGQGSVAMVHAGWRGAAACIVSEAIRRLDQETGTRPADLTAYLGPAISGRRYQVGPEVVDALARTGVPAATWLNGDRVDLRAFLTAQLEELGVGCIEAVGPCTFDTPLLASYRRDGASAGRQWSLVWRS